MSDNVGEAAKLIESEALQKWLRRALNDDERARDVEDVISELKEGGKSSHYEDQLVARVCIALAPSFPIRYRGIAALPSGVASLLADAATNPQYLSALSEIIASQMVTLWVQMQKDGKVDFLSIGQSFEIGRAHV